MNEFVITSMEPQKHDPSRRSVCVNGAFCFGADEETCVKEHLQVGNRYGAEELDRLREAAERADAGQYAFRLIAKREYSRMLLTRKITERGFSAETAAQVCEHLSELGYLNDADYASRFAHDAILLNRKGARLIESELLSRGIDRETAAAALEGKEELLADALAQTVRKRLTDPQDPKEIRRVFAYCLRRGFSSEEISQVLKELSYE